MADNNNKSIMFDGDAYEKIHGHLSRAVGRKFVNWLGLSGGLRWLDVGCGTGAASAMILAEGDPAQVVGIDASQSQILYASQHNDDQRAQFQVGDAQSMTFEEDEFDVAISGLVLNLVPDPSKAIAEMKRVVRPSGTVATYIWDIAEDGHPASPLVNGFSHLDPNAPRFGGGGRRMESENDILQLFGEGALANLVTNKIEILVRHKSFEDYWADVLISQGPPGAYLKAMTSKEVVNLKGFLMDTVPTNGAGEVVYPACAWSIRGNAPEG